MVSSSSSHDNIPGFLKENIGDSFTSPTFLFQTTGYLPDIKAAKRCGAPPLTGGFALLQDSAVSISILSLFSVHTSSPSSFSSSCFCCLSVLSFFCLAFFMCFHLLPLSFVSAPVPSFLGSFVLSPSRLLALLCCSC